MVLHSPNPAAVAGILQATGGDDISTRVDVFEEIYLFFLVLGTLVGVVVVSYMLHKAYKYRAGSGREYDIDRPQLGELPTGADKGGRKLFLSFGLSAIIVVSLIGWTYGWLLYVETGAADPGPDDLQVEVTGEDFVWSFEYQDDQRLPSEALNQSVEDLGRQTVLDALERARANEGVTMNESLSRGYAEQTNGSVDASTVQTNLTTLNVFRVPVDRKVYIYATSGDVWHNFGISEFRVKADALPGETTTTWFVAENEGDYVAECFELCGSGHSSMEADVNAMPQEEFQTWYSGETIAVEDAIERLENGGGNATTSTAANAASSGAADTAASQPADAEGGTAPDAGDAAPIGGVAA